MNLPPRLLLLHRAGADWHLLQRGVMGKLVSTAPLHPAALAASLLSGRHADAHGVLGWTLPLADEPHGPGLRPLNSSDWQAAPLWQWAQAQGVPACAVGFPVTHPASTAGPGVAVSDAFAMAQGADFDAWPAQADAVAQQRLSAGTAPDAACDTACDADLAATLAGLRLHPADISPEQLLTFLPQAARIDQETDSRLAELVVALAEAATVHSVATYLAEHRPWQLLAVHFDFIEQISSRFIAYRAPRRADISAADQCQLIWLDNLAACQEVLSALRASGNGGAGRRWT